MDIKKYKSLVSQASNLNIETIIEKSLYEKLEKAVVNNSFYLIKDELSQKIKHYLQGDGYTADEIFFLKKKLIREYFYFQNEKSLLLVNILNKSCFYDGRYTTLTSDDNDWLKVISLVNYYLSHSSDDLYSEDNIKRTHLHEKFSVEACLFFKKKGFDICVRQGEITQKSFKKIFQLIDFKLSRLGSTGVDLIQKPFHKRRSPTTRLFNFQLSTTINGYPSIPWGFLYQISLRHIHIQSSLSNDKVLEELKYVFELCSNFAALFELQQYGHDYEIMSVDEVGIFDKLKKIKATDSLFKIEQYIPEDIYDFVQYLSKKYSTQINQPNELQLLTDFIAFIRDLSKRTYYFSVEDFANYLSPKSYSQNELYSFLEMFAHKKINQNFNSINCRHEIDFNVKPILKTQKGYRILIQEFHSVGYYRVLQGILKQHNLNNKLGDDIEEYLSFKLDKKQIEHLANARYDLSAEKQNKLELKDVRSLECDIILQNESKIIFCESKKKELTNVAKNGDIFYILQDLSRSLLKSQLQANRHMRVIKEYEEITFNDGTIIKENNRDIYKLSLSSLDYQSLHSKDVFHRFMLLMYYSQDLELTKENIDMQKILDDFNQLNSKLKIDISQEHSKFQIEDASGFLNTIFLNIFHFLYLIRISKDINDLINNLTCTKHIIMTGYRDFYSEFEYYQSIQK